MKTRHLVDGYFIVNFQRSLVIADLWRPKVARH